MRLTSRINHIVVVQLMRYVNIEANLNLWRFREVMCRTREERDAYNKTM
jgi:hypothetical protein